MGHLVKCAICGQSFDRDKIQAVKHGARRYAHYDCYPEGEKVPLVVKVEDPDLTKLKEYIVKLYGDKANWALINKQIKKFTTENGYSLSGILKSLVYFYEVKKNPIDDKTNYGIGIVPFTYQAAYNYYFSIFMAQQANENKSVNNSITEITIKPPKGRNYLKREFFNLEEWEANEEQSLCGDN